MKQEKVLWRYKKIKIKPNKITAKTISQATSAPANPLKEFLPLVKFKLYSHLLSCKYH